MESGSRSNTPTKKSVLLETQQQTKSPLAVLALLGLFFLAVEPEQKYSLAQKKQFIESSMNAVTKKYEKAKFDDGNTFESKNTLHKNKYNKLVLQKHSIKEVLANALDGDVNEADKYTHFWSQFVCSQPKRKPCGLGCLFGGLVAGGLTLLFSPVAIVSDVFSVLGGDFPGATKELFNRFAATIGSRRTCKRKWRSDNWFDKIETKKGYASTTLPDCSTAEAQKYGICAYLFPCGVRHNEELIDGSRKGYTSDVPTARCAAFRRHYLNTVLKAEKFKFDVLQEAQEDIVANANPKGAVRRVNAQFHAIYMRHEECKKRKETDPTVKCAKWEGRRVKDRKKEIVYFGTYKDPKDANREKIDKITIHLKRSFQTTGSFSECARHLENPLDPNGKPCFEVVNPRYKVVYAHVEAKIGGTTHLKKRRRRLLQGSRGGS